MLAISNGLNKLHIAVADVETEKLSHISQTVKFCNCLMKPNLFLVGAPKCGTTALSEYLKTHPLILMAEPKEPHYFSFDLKTISKRSTSDLNYMEEYFHNASQKHYIIGEASVFYLYSKVAIKKILQFNPEAKFIVMVRNPIDLAYSLHSQYVFMGQENVHDFLEAWRLQSMRAMGGFIPEELTFDVKLLLYGEIAKLGLQVNRLLNMVDENMCKIIVFEDFIKHTSQVYKEVLEFLELPNDNRKNFPKLNYSRKIKSKFIADILRSRSVINSIILTKRLLRIRSFGFGRPQVPITKSINEVLKPYFREDVNLLSRLIRRDLSYWLHNV